MKSVKNNAVKLLGLVLVAVISVSAHALSDKQRQAMEERIKPVGEVCLEGDNSCGGAVAAVSSGPKSGDEVYNASCSACHSTGAAGAPKLGDVADWANRVGKGIEVLYSSSIDGFQGMPAKGLCMSCSDEELKAAVDYMVDSSK